MKKPFSRVAMSLWAILWTCLTACGTLQIGIEQTPVATQIVVPTAEKDSGYPITEAMTRTIESYPAYIPTTAVPASIQLLVEVPNLRLTFVLDQNIQFWDPTNNTQQITVSGSVTHLDLSDDGQRVAFTREDGTLWLVYSDGRPEVELVTKADLLTAVPEADEVFVNQFAWLPGTHALLFNTRQMIGDYSVTPSSDDLWLLDTDTQTIRLQLPPGEGGNFVPAPNGQQVVVITPDHISLLDVNSGQQQLLFSYEPVITYSELPYYAQPVWSADATWLRVAIPPVDPQAIPKQPASIWQIPTDHSEPLLLLQIIPLLAPIGGWTPVFSSDSSHFLFQAQSDLETSHTLTIGEIHDSGYISISPFAAGAVPGSWSPDSTLFTFLGLAQPFGDPSWQIGKPDSSTVSLIGAKTSFQEVRWIDTAHLLFLVQTGFGWQLVLGELGADGITGTIIALPVDPSVPYDFANPPGFP